MGQLNELHFHAEAPSAAMSAPGLPSSDQTEHASGGGAATQAAARPARAALGSGEGNERGKVLGVCLFLAIIIWTVFGETRHFDFVNFDDDEYVYKNPPVAHGLTLAGIDWAFCQSHAENWHPLTWLSHMLDCQFYGLNAGGPHVSNVLLHTTAAILLFLVLRRMTGRLWCSAWVAAVFAIHPLRAESVAWVSERKDVLSGVFFMVALGAYAAYARRPSLARYALVFLLMALGLLCKPMLVTLPCVLLLLDYWPLRRWRTGPATSPVNRAGKWPLPRDLWWEKLPLFGLAAASVVVTVIAQNGAIQSLDHISLTARVGNALVSCTAYLAQMFWPSHLAVLYPFPAHGGVLWQWMLALAVLLGITAGAWAGRERHPYLMVGWLWYLVMLAPVIGIIQVGPQAHADRYTYLPQIGLYISLAWLAADLSTRWPCRRFVLGGGSAIILGALMLGAHAQTAYWRNSESLWQRTLACTKDNELAENNLGDVLLQAGRVAEAAVHFQKALLIRPNYAEARNNFGNALLQQGAAAEAVKQYQSAIEIKSNYADAHYNLGNALFQMGEMDAACLQFETALQLKPGVAETHNSLGVALLQKGDANGAVTHLQKALELNPQYAEAQNNLGLALLQTGRVGDAIMHFQKAVELKADYAQAHNNLGAALLQQRRVDEAVVHDKIALQLQPDYAQAQFNLGDALLQKGEAGEAIAHFHRALELTPDSEEVLNKLAWVLATCSQASLRNGPQAVQLALRANKLAGAGDPIVLAGLAAAYAEAGRFPEAVETVERAVDLAESQSNSGLAEALRAQRELYQAGHPFRIP